MTHTLLLFMPLLACPLGMALMVGVPAFVHRVRGRRQKAKMAAVRNDTMRDPARQAA